jgi:hypothetical protein
MHELGVAKLRMASQPYRAEGQDRKQGPKSKARPICAVVRCYVQGEGAHVDESNHC